MRYEFDTSKTRIIGNGDKIIVEIEDENHIPINTPMMCQTSSSLAWVLRYYAGCQDGIHKVFTTDNCIASGWKGYMIPYDKFNPNNIKESLKYNIQK